MAEIIRTVRQILSRADRLVRDESLRTIVLFGLAALLTLVGIGHYSVVAGGGDPNRGHILALVAAGTITLIIAADGGRGE